MEAAVSGRHREIPEIRQELIDRGALGAVITGSGSAVLGVIRDGERAEAAKKSFSQKYRQVFLVKNA
jgi:4-diphosphocytidyl-2C-methyl-D-erythritol kinase